MPTETIVERFISHSTFGNMLTSKPRFYETNYRGEMRKKKIKEKAEKWQKFVWENLCDTREQLNQ